MKLTDKIIEYFHLEDRINAQDQLINHANKELLDAMTDIQHYEQARTGEYLDFIFDIQEKVLKLQHEVQEMADEQEALKSEISSHLYELKEIVFKIKLPDFANSFMNVTYKTNGFLTRSENYTVL